VALYKFDHKLGFLKGMEQLQEVSLADGDDDDRELVSDNCYDLGEVEKVQGQWMVPKRA
jgi:hypothetical protein